MGEDITEIKEVAIRNESKLDSICNKLDNIQQRMDYQRDFMNENREKINWNKNKVHVAIGGVSFALALIPIMLYFY